MVSDVRISYASMVGWVLLQARQSRGLSQAHVAERVGLTQSTWARIEKGLVWINAVQMAKFSDLVGEPVSVLYRRVEDAVAVCELHGQQVTYDRPVTPKTEQDPGAAVSGRFLFGTALAGVITGYLLSREP